MKSKRRPSSLSSRIRAVLDRYGWDAPTMFVQQVIGPVSSGGRRRLPTATYVQSVRWYHSPENRGRVRRELNSRERAAIRARKP
jgi:hypothetical protein